MTTRYPNTPAKWIKRSVAKEHALLTMLRNGRTLKEACARLGVTRQGVYYWRDQDPAFARELAAAKAAGKFRGVPEGSR